MKKIMKTLGRFFDTAMGVMYFPVYVAGFLLHFIARVLLAASYAMLLDRRKAADIAKSLFLRKR